jgi:hypothetical protein
MWGGEDDEACIMQIEEHFARHGMNTANWAGKKIDTRVFNTCFLDSLDTEWNKAVDRRPYQARLKYASIKEKYNALHAATYTHTHNTYTHTRTHTHTHIHK